MRLVKMPGDGNCLFHALAHPTGENGLRLREEMAQFLETAASEQGDYEDDWRAESEYLREDPTHWGGDTVIIAYTLLRRQRVTLHWPAADGHIHSDDRTHMQVTDELEEEGQDAIHLYYNGEDHYDLLLPARPAPPPPPPPPPASDPRPPRRKRARQGYDPSKPSPKPKANPDQPGPSADGGHHPPPPAQPIQQQGAILEELSHIQVAEHSAHPRRFLEDALTHFAHAKIREEPLVPPGESIESLDAGEPWPRVFCAFRGCNWTAPTGTDEDSNAAAATFFSCLFEVNWLIHRHSLDLPTAPSGAVPARRDGALGRAGARGAAHARARPRGRGPEHLQ